MRRAHSTTDNSITTNHLGIPIMDNRLRGSSTPRALRLMTTLLVASVLAGCDSLLRVDLPGTVTEDDLDAPALASTLVLSAIADLECAWNQYTAGTSLHSDEYIPSSGNLEMLQWGQRQIRAEHAGYAQGTCGGWGFPMYTALHIARFQGEDVFRRLSEPLFAEVPDLTQKQATVRAYGAYALVALGEGFCEMSVPEEEGVPGPLMTPGQVLELAEQRFTHAIELADQAGDIDIRNMSLVGRARVRLNQGDFEGAIDDATRVPVSYVKVATRDESTDRRYNYFFERMNARTGFRQHGSIADHFRSLTINAEGRPTQGDGVPDMRVNAQTTGALGSDNATIHWFHDKYTSRGDPVPLASGKEARLFIAEAAARTGDLVLARQTVNELRAEAGLPTFEPAVDQNEMIALVIEERRRALFVEGGHRLNDMLRFRGTQFEIPFLGEPGSIHPGGIDHLGGEYGPLTCLELPAVERGGNPNI